MKILGTGLSGLVGSRVVELLSPSFDFTNLSKETGTDITHSATVYERIVRAPGQWVFHFAAKTDVDGAEKERSSKEKSETWNINVTATGTIARACRNSEKSLLYISTDYVFDGTKKFYEERAIPNPQGWYAVTKHEGEKKVLELGTSGLIIRIANPYRAINTDKRDFLHKIQERLHEGLSVTAPNDQMFIPTFIDDIAYAIKVLTDNKACGIYHVVGSQCLTPYEAARKIARTFGYPASLVSQTSFKNFFAGRAPRPFYACLKNDKIGELGIRMHTLDEGLREIVGDAGQELLHTKLTERESNV